MRLDRQRIHWLELPHLKDQPESQKRWLAEVRRLVAFLEGAAGRRLTASALRDSMECHQRAWRVFGALVERRRRGLVPAVWFTVIANAFLRDDPVTWVTAVEKTLPRFEDARDGGKRVFLAGTPIFYPNLKLPELLEEAGLTVTADDLCSGERILPGATFYRDPSLDRLIAALAERYHQGCLCPTFADNERRPAGILSQIKHADGVVCRQKGGGRSVIVDHLTPALVKAGLYHELISKHQADNDGLFPEKVAVVVWAVETLRNEGVNEATILSLIGMEPVCSCTWAA